MRLVACLEWKMSTGTWKLMFFLVNVHLGNRIIQFILGFISIKRQTFTSLVSTTSYWPLEGFQAFSFLRLKFFAVLKFVPNFDHYQVKIENHIHTVEYCALADGRVAHQHQITALEEQQQATSSELRWSWFCWSGKDSLTHHRFSTSPFIASCYTWLNGKE